MSIGTKDIKILWAKAAGRCSICSKELSTEANSASKNTLIGENCHIIGEKINSGPRHKSNLSSEDRNRYPNLILLCANHHIEIDSDETEYTVEKLHQIKSDHEIWVQEALTERNETISDKLYSGLINFITEKFGLYRWDTITDHSIRTIMFNQIVSGMQDVVIHLNRINWPKKRIKLESAIIKLSQDTEIYINHYTKFAHPRSKDDWFENKKQYNDPIRGFPTSEGIEREKMDYRKHFINLWNLTVSLNRLARIVRDTINPEYFFFQGDFIMHDPQGVTNSIEGCVYFPNEYRTYDDH